MPDARLVGAPGRDPAKIVAAAARTLEKGDEPSLLRGLLPRGARSAVEAHAGGAAREARDASGRAEDAASLVRAALQSLDLPGRLDAFEDEKSFATHGALPDRLEKSTKRFRAASAALFGGGDQGSASEAALRDAAKALETARAKSAAALRDAREFFASANDDAPNAALATVMGVPRTAAETPQTATARRAKQAETALAKSREEDDALVSRCTSPAVAAALGALDGALGRDRAPKVDERLEFGAARDVGPFFESGVFLSRGASSAERGGRSEEHGARSAARSERARFLWRRSGARAGRRRVALAGSAPTSRPRPRRSATLSRA